MDLLQLLQKCKAPPGCYVSFSLGPNTNTEIVILSNSLSPIIKIFKPVSIEDELNWLNKTIDPSYHIFVEYEICHRTITQFTHKLFRINGNMIYFY